MKKTLTIVLIIILVVALIFILIERGKNTEKADLSAYSGIYKGKYTKFVGDQDTAKDTEREFSLELKADGTGTSNRDDASYNITWSVVGETFKMTETFARMTIDYTGTLKDGKIDIFNGDPSNDLTCEYVYSK